MPLNETPHENFLHTPQATCGALRITTPVARKPMEASFGRVLWRASEAASPPRLWHKCHDVRSQTSWEKSWTWQPLYWGLPVFTRHTIGLHMNCERMWKLLRLQKYCDYLKNTQWDAFLSALTVAEARCLLPQPAKCAKDAWYRLCLGPQPGGANRSFAVSPWVFSVENSIDIGYSN